jgi:hypothetical protein
LPKLAHGAASRGDRKGLIAPAFGRLPTIKSPDQPESLLASELFGHEKGAFTGADRRRIGKFGLRLVLGATHGNQVQPARLLRTSRQTPRENPRGRLIPHRGPGGR